MPQDCLLRSMPVPVFFESYSTLLVAHAQATVLGDLVISMRGAHIDPAAIAFVERLAAAAEQRMDALDTTFPHAVDEAILDAVRPALAAARQ